MDCQHERLELRGWEKPDDLAEGMLWLRDEYIVCLDCEAQLIYVPDDVSQIVNIPHPAREECQHTHKHHHLCSLGNWICLNCGETGTSSPASKLHFSSDPPSRIGINEPDPSSRIGINEPSPQADLNVVGVVSRARPTSLYADFGDVWPCGRLVSSFTEVLLQFEGKRVEITVMVLEDTEGGSDG